MGQYKLLVILFLVGAFVIGCISNLMARGYHDADGHHPCSFCTRPEAMEQKKQAIVSMNYVLSFLTEEILKCTNLDEKKELRELCRRLGNVHYEKISEQIALDTARIRTELQRLNTQRIKLKK